MDKGAEVGGALNINCVTPAHSRLRGWLAGSQLALQPGESSSDHLHLTEEGWTCRGPSLWTLGWEPSQLRFLCTRVEVRAGSMTWLSLQNLLGAQ